jgi:hypothetical protein
MELVALPETASSDSAAKSPCKRTVVSNPDIRFPDESLLKNLHALEEISEIGVTAPDIRLARDCEEWIDGVAQNPFHVNSGERLRAFRCSNIWSRLSLRCRHALRTASSATAKL